MRVELGPLPSRSVLAWVGFARGVLAEVGPATRVPLVDEYQARLLCGYLDEWERRAATDPEFVWSGTAEPEAVEYMLVAWLRVEEELEARRREGKAPRAPREAEPFYRMLLHSVLDALAAEGRATEAFAEHLRTAWPGLDDSPATAPGGRNPAAGCSP